MDIKVTFTNVRLACCKVDAETGIEHELHHWPLTPQEAKKTYDEILMPDIEDFKHDIQEYWDRAERVGTEIASRRGLDAVYPSFDEHYYTVLFDLEALEFITHGEDLKEEHP